MKSISWAYLKGNSLLEHLLYFLEKETKLSDWFTFKSSTFLFNSHLIYGCQVWGQYQGTLNSKKIYRNIARESRQNHKVFTKSLMKKLTDV